MPGTSSINGVVSGISTDEIITKLMEIVRQPVKDLEVRQKDLKDKLAAWQEFNTRLLALQTKASNIATSSQFQAHSAISSDEDIVTASASSTAAPGKYFLKVTQLAQSHQVSSQGFATMTDAVGVGKVTISQANGKSFSVDITDNNNTLAGLRDAINKADSGVTAVIVNTGQAGTPYKLVLTSDDSGEDYAMTVDTSGLDNPARPLINQEVQAAQDATIELGTGAGKISITKSTNTITDVIPGVTLNLQGTDLNKTVSLTVSTDTSAMATTIDDFVKQYNNIVDFLDSQMAYDPEATKQGVLFADSMLQTLQSELADAVLNPVAGLTQSMRTLGEVGITMDQFGKLNINSAELRDALDNHLDQVMNIFSVGFDSDNSGVSYISNTSETKASTSAGYSVSVTQAPLRASATAGTAQLGNLTQNEALVINGVTILLDAGWSQQQVIDKINDCTKWTGVQASATGAGGTGTGNYLTLTQTMYGTYGHITVKSDTSYTSGTNTGLGNVEITETSATGESGLGSGTVGQNMIGTINGIPAKVQGQYLIGEGGPTGKDGAKGLKIRIDTTGPMTTTVRFTRGVAAAIRDLSMAETDTNGIVTVAEEGLNEDIGNITEQMASLNERLQIKQDRLYAQFNAMEDALAKLQQQGNSIAALVSSMSSNSSSKK